ncbi:MAG: tetratricopeptide repeat protein [Spirochaetaceae bacterium]|nr:tetratricopeptide repeat protein [Spirochaetaceae bacterium]
MSAARNRFGSGVQLHRKHTIATISILILVFMTIGGSALVFAGWRNRQAQERREILALWNGGSYREAFDLSGERLAAKPTNYLFLTVHGFSAFQLAAAQINAQDTQAYIDECIRTLRKALLSREAAGDFRIHYVLGKAYYYKGSGYEDLALRYLEEARDGGFSAGDMPELLGLAYAAVHDYRSSVAAFSGALSPGDAGEDAPPDLLLLSIARSYLALEDYGAARAYLTRLTETSRDSAAIIAAELLLGDIAVKTGDTSGAEAWYQRIIEENGENAEARFQLGELYAQGGDATRARAEWRRALRTDPAHRLARVRLNL